MKDSRIELGDTALKMDTMKTLGVPYAAEDIAMAKINLEKQGRAIAEDLDAHRKTVLADHPHLTLTGLYNVENALAASAAALALDLPPEAVARALRAFEPAFGRQEHFAIEGRDREYSKEIPMRFLSLLNTRPLDAATNTNPVSVPAQGE